MFEISFFIGNQENVKPDLIQEYKTWEDLVGDSKLSACVAGGKHEDYFTRGACDRRNDVSIKESRLLIIDGDYGATKEDNAPDPEDVADALKRLNFKFLITTTHSHRSDGIKNKFRVLVPTDRPMEKHELKYNLTMLLRMLKKEGVVIGHCKEMFTWSQPWFCPKRDDPSDGLYYCESSVSGKDWGKIDVAKSTYSDTEVQSEGDGRARLSVVRDIASGKDFHGSLTKESWQFLLDCKKGGKEVLDAAYHPCLNMNRIYMELSADAGSERWQARYDDLPNQVRRSIAKLKDVDSDIDKGRIARQVGVLPKFPVGIMETWPDPWPMIYRNYVGVAREPVEELLVATILSSCAHSLNNKYVTMEGKFLNLIFLNLASSGVGKDANTTSVLRELSRIFQRRKCATPIDPFARFMRYDSNLTSDTAFMQCFDENGCFYWVNTEATRIFELIGQKGNASVAAISDKIVEVGDGMGISTKKKVSQKDNAPSQDNPNVQILLCAQPDTISQYLTPNMVDSGLFGRPLVSISDKDMDLDQWEMFGNRDVRDLSCDKEFIDLFLHLYNIPHLNMLTKPIPLGQTPEMIRELNLWMRGKVAPLMKSDPMLTTVLRRMGIPIEQVYTTILAIIREYEIYKYGNPRTEEIDVKKIFPLLDFWVDCKTYATEHLVRNSADPLWEAVTEIMEDMLSFKIKMSKPSHARAIKEHKVPICKIANTLASRSKKLRLLGLSNDKGSLLARLKVAIEAAASMGVVIRCQSQTGVDCIAFAKT